MKHLKLAVLALFTLVTLKSINAQDKNNPWAIGIGTNIVDFYSSNAGFEQNIKDHLGNSDWNFLPSISRITVEKYLKDGFSIQFLGTANEITTLQQKDDSDFLYYSLGLNAKYDINNLIGNTGWFDPYVSLGGLFVSVDNKSEGMLATGIGFNAWFNEKIGINFETGSRFGFADNVGSHIQSSLGIVIKFGGTDTDGDGVYDKYDACPEVAGLDEFNGCPDTDGDGIKDSDDACPEVAGSALLNGCPDTDGDGIADKDDDCPEIKGTKANKGCPDSDGDGIVDKNDKCPSVIGIASNEGCPLPDSDNDGVADKDDDCPNTAGIPSNNGCPEGMISPQEAFKILENSRKVLFDTGKHIIKADHSQYLDEIAEIMNNNTQSIFTLEGNTDTTGSDKFNERLSEDRAEVIKNYLIQKGVVADRLSTVGNSDTKPVATNETKEGRSKNRRTDIRSTN